MLNIEEFIESVNGLDKSINTILTRGGCYRFAKLLQSMYGGELCAHYSDFDGEKILDHCALLYDGRVYDINGWTVSPVGKFSLLTKEEEKAKEWDFTENMETALDYNPIEEVRAAIHFYGDKE